MMRNIVFLSKEYSWTYQEVLDMPYGAFLSFLKWTRIMQLESTEEGKDMLYKENTIHQSEPDLMRFRQHLIKG